MNRDHQTLHENFFVSTVEFALSILFGTLVGASVGIDTEKVGVFVCRDSGECFQNMALLYKAVVEQKKTWLSLRRTFLVAPQRVFQAPGISRHRDRQFRFATAPGSQCLGVRSVMKCAGFTQGK